MLTEKECIDIAKPRVEIVVNLIAANDYEDIADIISQTDISYTDLQIFVQTYLDMNELDGVDGYDVECNFNPDYEYHQLSVYPFDDESGFAADYDLTTGGELNDMTLQLEFKKIEGGHFMAYLKGIDILQK